jgi:hypothetical protein
MALIACPECTKQVADSALSCPNCGFAIASARETRAAGAPLTTIQETSKKFKIHTIISVLAIIIGVVWLVGVPNAAEQGGESSFIAPLLIFAGLVWFIVTKIRIWWHHK